MLGRLIRNLAGLASPAPVPAPAKRPVYFVHADNYMFGLYMPLIWGALGPRAQGVVSDKLAGNEVCSGTWRLPVLSMSQFQDLTDDAQPTDLVHFCDDLRGFEELSERQLKATAVKDFVATLAELDLQHTYAPLRKEQEWWRTHTKEYDRLNDGFGDDLSRQTLAARRQAILCADRRPLMKVSVGAACEYFNATSPHLSLVPGEREIYVDVGAAHGDTVDKFSQVTGGRFEKIYAFEPSPGQFSQLRQKQTADGRIQAFQAAVGDTPGKLVFFDNLDNPFAGNVIHGGGRETEVDCLRLDDVVERCTLIKMDVEGFECSVLRGARRLIGECRPDLAVTYYHYPQDMSEIAELVKSLHPYRNVALRHYGPCLHDSILLFSDRQAFNA